MTQPNPLDPRASYIASDYPGDWLKMSEPQRDYWRRIAQRSEDFDAEQRRLSEQQRTAA